MKIEGVGLRDCSKITVSYEAAQGTPGALVHMQHSNVMTGFSCDFPTAVHNPFLDRIFYDRQYTVSQ